MNTGKWVEQNTHHKIGDMPYWISGLVGWELLKFQTVVKLHENVRAEGNDSKQNLFRQLQMWVRDDHSSLEDWELLLSRNPTKVENLQNFENCAVKLSFGNEKVARDPPIIHIDA